MRVGDGREKVEREREYLRVRDSRWCKREWERERDGKWECVICDVWEP